MDHGVKALSIYVEAYHTSNSESDNFVFAYSTTGVNGTYTDMVTVTKTSDNNTTENNNPTGSDIFIGFACEIKISFL